MSKTKKLTSFQYSLEVPIEYAYKGDMQEGTFITVKAPTSKHMDDCADLKQAFFQSLPTDKDGAAEADDATSDTKDKLTGEAIMTLISMSPKVKLKDVLHTAKRLFTSGLAKIEGEEKLTTKLIDDMDQDDLEAMTGEFLLNFTLASALKKLNLT